MASAIGIAPKFAGDVAERVHACEIELYERELRALQALTGWSSTQLKLYERLKLAIDLLRDRGARG